MQVEIAGYVAPGFETVKDCFAENWNRIEVGASFCALQHGEVICDLWGGWQDREMIRPWQNDTLVNVYSTTKGIAALVMAMLVDEGKLSYDRPVADYWPEFAAAGKEKVTVAQLLSHQAGLAGVETALTVNDLYDWNKMTSLLAEQRPLWPPGQGCGYHAVTWGYFPGELCLRLTGKTLGTYFQERVGTPLQADFHIGLPQSEHHRIADLIGPNHARKESQQKKTGDNAALPPFSVIAQQNPAIRPYKDACSTAWREAEIAASNGHGNASGIARIYGALADGGKLRGIQIISPAALKEATKLEVDLQQDLVLGLGLRRSRGFILNTRDCYGPAESAFGHNGAGGSSGFADPVKGLGIGYAMNQMENDATAESRAARLVNSVYQCLARKN